jgi:putative membrane protein
MPVRGTGGNFRLHAAFVVVTAVLLALSLVRPRYPQEQLLQHAPTVVALAFLALAARRGWLPTRSFVCITLFVGLHILGARYIYSYVPYDAWTTRLCGVSLAEWFDWKRNHYDRLVHACFGMLGALTAAQIGQRTGRITPSWAAAFAVCAVMTVSALYECFEWLLTVIMSPRHADAYNGQQGDAWDAQKDMALAFLGSLAAVTIDRGCHRRGKKPI